MGSIQLIEGDNKKDPTGMSKFLKIIMIHDFMNKLIMIC